MFPVEYVTTAVTHEGATVGAVLMFRDVSDRVALDQAKGQFVALVSHELRTPLTSIKGNLKLLEAGVVGPLTEKQRSLLSAAVANSARLESLVNDLLDMERLDDGKLPIHPETVSARDLASQSVAAIKGAADAVSIPVGLDVADCPDDTWVVVDPNRMLQVLTNLLGNALKFSERGQHVNVVVNRCGDAVTIAVVDAGRGIPESEVGHIFDRFSQVDSRDTRQVGGVGLGLAIARELVTRSGGTLDVVSQVGSGSTFTVHLPAA
jgi:signal transduction histidine kinase